MERLSLADLGVDEDPGCAWHPRPDKTEVWDSDGNLRDLNEAVQRMHLAKPEQYPDSGEPLSAEDSVHSGEGEV